MSTEAIVALVTAGVALLGVAVGAFFGLLNVIRAENRELRTEFREANAQLRTEFREEISSLRTELREDNARLREEVREENARLREDNTRLREEVREENTRLRTELLAEIRAGNQQILDALYNHRHDPGTGAVVIYPPQAAAD
jgi:predicted nuclease with TOPRIM domain